MTFGAPLAFVLLVFVLAIGALSLWLAIWRRGARRLFAGEQAASWQTRSPRSGVLFLLAAASLIVLAAARPQWGSEELRRQRQGVDLVIALDVSQSMQAKDVAPSRLESAQEELASLIQAMRGSRIGLVFFAGTAIVRSPLTTDTKIIAQLIREARRDASLTQPGSNLGAGLDQASRILEASDSGGRAVLVVSDGEDFGDTASDAARGLNARGIAVFVAGVGTPAGSTITVTLPNGTTQTKIDAGGQPIITRLDEAKLRAVADAGGGRYLAPGAGKLLDLKSDLDRLQQTPRGVEAQTRPVERMQWFIAAAIALLALSWLWPGRLRLRVPAVLLSRASTATLVLFALIVGVACGGESIRGRNEAANRLYEAGDFEQALQAYQKLLAERPDLPELSYNAGNALHRLGRFERAIEETQRALPPTGARLGAATYYALGNHFLALDRPEDAYEAYKSALLLDPSDLDAKHNLELALRRLRQRQPSPGTAASPGTPAPEGQPGQPGAGAPPDQAPAGSQPSPGDVQRSLQEALAGIDRELTPEEAIYILDLLRQQRQGQRGSGQPPTSVGRDY